jgi:hypothetical protein
MEIRNDGSVEIIRDEYDMGQQVAASPTIARVDDSRGLYQPQSATFHRSFSAEGEDLAVYDLASDEGHR